MIRLAAALRSLKHLHLTSTMELTDIAVLALAQHAHQLRILVLNKSRGLTEEALGQLAQSCRRLESHTQCTQTACRLRGR